MIDLRITTKFKEEEAWKAQLKEWCVAHKITEDPSLDEPILLEAKKITKGLAAIETFLQEYKAFMDDWYDCRCDKWMDK
ncbi:hypothetical protein SAMN04488029_3614 [Reichenbachiella faecimaris]|uniref:Uncharacterized protein n=1 Tax=Reichenbachiella faecimaris TaxID=692418 RepID=A0A1W2GN23_REIFA|nr:hypothetical protein [Reichenbachiella faecimaris]SMD38063.1 hypothetical protein SAMN04488029_3614 [Reichenbachiella faecimaris]